MRLKVVALLIGFALPVSVRAPAQDAVTTAGTAQVIADFDKTDAPVSLAGKLRLAETPDARNTFLSITSPAGGALTGQLTFDLIARVKPNESSGFSFRLRAVGGPAKARLIALDEQGNVILQRRLDVEPSDQLQAVAVPWARWRWGDDTGGSPGEIRHIGLRIENGPAELQLDDLALTPAVVGAGEGWLRRVAFGERDVRIAEAEGLLVATDAVDGPEQLTDADLTAILGRMRSARKLVHRLFGDAARPIDGPTPPSLLIFRRQADFAAFFEAAGTEWNVRIAPPTGGGLTVGNLAATTFDPKQGANRPLFLHESIHAVFANDLRLLSGHDRHSWLHEGLASYVQLCVYPKSIDRRALGGNFRRPIAPDGKSFFKPLEQVLGRRVAPQQYAQVGTLVAYVVDRKPQWLPIIAKSLAAGGTAEDAFRKCGTTLDDLQDAWLKWGAEKVGDTGDAGPMLPVPPEFAPADTR